MTKLKSVTISITEDEFDAIHHAFNEYNTKLESSDSEEYNKFAYTQLDNFESFQKKYWRAVQTRQRRDAIKKALIYAKSKD